jgi:hypothetical protein
MSIGHKLRKTQGGIIFWCPACRTGHEVKLGRNGWAWNNREDFPTIAPSIYTKVRGKNCHCIVRDGRIEYLTDSTHDLRGKSVELPDWPF